MRLKGFAPDIHALSFVNSPDGTVVGSSAPLLSKIVSVPGARGPDGPTGRGYAGVSIDGNDLVFDATDETEDRVTVPAISAATTAAADAAASASAAAATVSGKAPINNPTFTGVVVTPSFKMNGNGYGAGKFLQSDSTGFASWVTLSSGHISDSGVTGRALLAQGSAAGARSVIAAEEADNPYTSLVWHDVLAFNRVSTPVFEQSTNGTVWTAASTANGNKMFAQKENQSVSLVDGTTTPYWRVTWSSGMAWSNIDRLLLGFSYVAGTMTRNITVESSVDGTTWTTRYSAVGNNTVANPLDVDITAFGGDTYLRITIQQTSGLALRMNSIKGLSRRMGDQGLGRETSFPYVWDEDRKLGLGTNNLPTSGLIRIGDDTTLQSGGLQFGTDTYLYRDSTNTLRSSGVIIGTQVRASTAAPAGASDLTRKDYVDTEVAKKVASATGLTSRVYTRDAAGADTTIGYTSAASATTIALRGTGGILSVGTPTNTDHATTKAYVDAADATKANAYTGQTPTIWYGTQAEYDALASGTKNAAGFVAVIRP